LVNTIENWRSNNLIITNYVSPRLFKYAKPLETSPVQAEKNFQFSQWQEWRVHGNHSFEKRTVEKKVVKDKTPVAVGVTHNHRWRYRNQCN